MRDLYIQADLLSATNVLRGTFASSLFSAPIDFSCDLPDELVAGDIRTGWRLGARRRTQALDGVSLNLARGASLGLVGESGRGKSTLARILIGLDVRTSGDLMMHK